jgi:magnesium-transporting ATPase (P-type)
MFLKFSQFALDNRSMMYRGSKLVNTKWVYGVAIFTGNQTKIMKNNIRGRFKQSSMEDTLNRIILCVFVVLLAIMLFGAIGIAAEVPTYNTWSYLLYDSSPFVSGVVNFFTFFILFSGLVPISLYVYLELVKVGHVIWIDWDVEMYYREGDTRANAKSNLSDDLGMIS